MARSHEPANGSDRSPLNGNRGKQVAVALFIATSFGIMAILSFPLSKVARLPLKLPHPLEAALSPIERLIRPVVPWLGKPSGNRPPNVPVAVALQRPRSGAPPGPGSVGPGGPGSVPPVPPGEPPPGGGESPTLPPTLTLRALTKTLIGQLTTILSNRTRRLSPEDARLIQAELSTLLSMRAACLADPTCAERLKLLEKLLHRLDAHQRGRHEGELKHDGRKHGPAKGSSHASQGASHGRGRGHGHRHKPDQEATASRGRSHEKRSHRKHRKHHKRGPGHTEK
ncbi:MAG TPA: hypothetical protein VGL18_02360 [Actinomycetota bacterium]